MNRLARRTLTRVLLGSAALLSSVSPVVGDAAERLEGSRTAARAGTASASAASEPMPLATIGAAARAFLRARHADDPSLDIAGGRLDERLRLARCVEPLETRLAPGSRDVGRVTVRVSCPSPPAWRVHVQLEVTRERELWTFARAVRRGERLDRAMLARRTVTLGRDASRLARGGTPIDSPDAWQGHELARDARAGEPLTASLLTPRRLVERGASVRLRADGAGLRIETRGVALADGAVGERVTVRNVASGRTVEGRVDGPGSVVVSTRGAGGTSLGERPTRRPAR